MAHILKYFSEQGCRKSTFGELTYLETFSSSVGWISNGRLEIISPLIFEDLKFFLSLIVASRGLLIVVASPVAENVF